MTLATATAGSFTEGLWRALSQSGEQDAAGRPPFHQPVLLRQTVDRLAVRPGGVYVDATVGEGGHSMALLEASAPDGKVLGIDWDPRTLGRAVRRLEEFGERFVPVQGNYADMADLARQQGIGQADGVLLDLGFSSRQLEAEGYGFSFQRDETLDMRYNPEEGRPTAADIVNTYSQDALARLLRQYGEEPRARAVARALVAGRPVRTTGDLARLVSSALGRGAGARINPATRTFQALRIAVNGELDNLARGLAAALELLAAGGRLAVVSYHSLEDRLVKNTLDREAARCICPPELPVCVCGHQPTVRLLGRRVIKPEEAEVRANPRSRSARMRVAERL